MVGVMRRMVGAVLVGCALVLGGCGGASPAPEPSPSATAEPSAPEPPTPAPTPSASAVARPERPADMDRTDEVGAAAAAEYFLELYPYVLATGDSVDWLAMSSDACGFCSGIGRDAADVRAREVTYAGGAIELLSLKVLKKDEAVGGYPVESIFVQEPETRRDPAGNMLSETEGDSGSIRIDTIRLDGAWQILAVVVSDA